MMRSEVVNLQALIDEPVSWNQLRHDRERHIWREAFMCGVGVGLQHFNSGYWERQAILRLIEEAARRDY